MSLWQGEGGNRLQTDMTVFSFKCYVQGISVVCSLPGFTAYRPVFESPLGILRMTNCTERRCKERYILTKCVIFMNLCKISILDEKSTAFINVTWPHQWFFNAALVLFLSISREITSIIHQKGFLFTFCKMHAKINLSSSIYEQFK